MVGGLDAWREGLCQTLADGAGDGDRAGPPGGDRSEEHTSELQSQSNLVCRLLLEKKKSHVQKIHRSLRCRQHRPVTPSVCPVPVQTPSRLRSLPLMTHKTEDASTAVSI